MSRKRWYAPVERPRAAVTGLDVLKNVTLPVSRSSWMVSALTWLWFMVQMIWISVFARVMSAALLNVYNFHSIGISISIEMITVALSFSMFKHGKTAKSVRPVKYRRFRRRTSSRSSVVIQRTIFHRHFSSLGAPTSKIPDVIALPEHSVNQPLRLRGGGRRGDKTGGKKGTDKAGGKQSSMFDFFRPKRKEPPTPSSIRHADQKTRLQAPTPTPAALQSSDSSIEMLGENWRSKSAQSLESVKPRQLFVKEERKGASLTFSLNDQPAVLESMYDNDDWQSPGAGPSRATRSSATQSILRSVESGQPRSVSRSTIPLVPSVRNHSTYSNRTDMTSSNDHEKDPMDLSTEFFKSMSLSDRIDRSRSAFSESSEEIRLYNEELHSHTSDVPELHDESQKVLEEVLAADAEWEKKRKRSKTEENERQDSGDIKKDIEAITGHLSALDKSKSQALIVDAILRVTQQQRAHTAPRPNRIQVESFFRAVETRLVSDTGLAITKADTEHRSREYRGIMSDYGIPDPKLAMPTGNSQAALGLQLAWGPGYPDRPGIGDSILTRVSATPRKLMDKGLTAGTRKLYCFDSVEPRIPHPNWRNLPSFETGPDATVESFFKGKSIDPTQQLGWVEMTKLSIEHHTTWLTDMEVPRFTVSLGKFSHNAAAAALQSLNRRLYTVLEFKVEVPVPALPSIKVSGSVYQMPGLVVLDQHGDVLRVILNGLHPSASNFGGPRDVLRFGQGFALDMSLNLVYTMSGIKVPKDQFALFSRECVPFASAQEMSPPWAFTRAMEVARLSGTIHTTTFEDLDKSLQKWIVDNDLQAGLTRYNAAEKRSWMSRVWGVWCSQRYYGISEEKRNQMVARGRETKTANPWIMRQSGAQAAITRKVNRESWADEQHQTAYEAAAAQGKRAAAARVLSMAANEAAQQKSGGLSIIQKARLALGSRGNKRGTQGVHLLIFDDKPTILITAVDLSDPQCGPSAEVGGQVVFPKQADQITDAMRKHGKGPSHAEIFRCHTHGIYYFRWAQFDHQDRLVLGVANKGTRKCLLCDHVLISVGSDRANTLCRPVRAFNGIIKADPKGRQVLDSPGPFPALPDPPIPIWTRFTGNRPSHYSHTMRIAPGVGKSDVYNRGLGTVRLEHVPPSTRKL